MDPALPLTRLTLFAGSVAQDLAFVALVDAAKLFFEEPEPQGMLIGGQMVTLHAYRWGLGAELYRESLDTDMGLPLVTLNDPSLPGRIAELGYQGTSGNTFAKRVTDIRTGASHEEMYAVIELLAPAFTSRPRDSIKRGGFVVTEVPGLAVALRDSVTVDLELTRLNGQSTATRVALQDEAGCLILRAHAWRKRMEDRDAIDVWRALEIASRAHLAPEHFVSGPRAEAASILRTSFGHAEAAGVRAALAGRGLVPTAPLAPRIVALLREVVGS